MIGYHILNLPFREFRRGLALGNLVSMDVPDHLIFFHDAPYGGDYSSREALQAAAVSDGFKGFASDAVLGGRGSMACLWGSLQIVRKIAEEGFEYGYYTQDDFLLLQRFGVMCQVTQILSHDSRYVDDSEFLFLQLTVNPELSTDPSRNPWLFEEFPGLICKGIGGSGDSGILMSQPGARYLLERFEKHPRPHFYHLFDDVPPEVKGVYSISDVKDWIDGVPDFWYEGVYEDTSGEVQDRSAVDALDAEAEVSG